MHNYSMKQRLREYDCLFIEQIKNEFNYHMLKLQNIYIGIQIGLMKLKDLEVELRNYKIRQGMLYKRSRFLKEWRERWIVLTMNFMISFETRQCKQITDIINLKDFKCYKSYVRKEEEMISSGFKIIAQDKQFVFCARSPNEKWSWFVTIERLMDYKEKGASDYNNIDQIKTKGFDSQQQFTCKKKLKKVRGSFSTLAQGQKLQGFLNQLSQQDEQLKSLMNPIKQADLMLKKLMSQQYQLNEKQEQLKRKETLLNQKQILINSMTNIQQSPSKSLQQKSERVQTSENDLNTNIDVSTLVQINRQLCLKIKELERQIQHLSTPASVKYDQKLVFNQHQ